MKISQRNESLKKEYLDQIKTFYPETTGSTRPKFIRLNGGFPFYYGSEYYLDGKWQSPSNSIFDQIRNIITAIIRR